MPNTYNSQTFSTTYFDDFADSAGYHRLLFNSGRALQARELTQLQTIMQNEIARFGRNIFKEGASVSTGNHSINNQYNYVKVTSSITTPAGSGFSDIAVGTLLLGGSSNVKARVLQAVAAEGADPNTLYVQYVSTGTQAIAEGTIKFSPGEELTGGGYTFTVESGANAVGQGCKIDVGEGDVFVLGHFVYVRPQSLILNKYEPNYDGDIGYKVYQDIITVNDTEDLYDNSGGVANLASPGADRYRIRLELTKKEDVPVDETFAYYASIENASIKNVVEEIDDYAKINDLLATRTKEESGNYIVDPFVLTFVNNAYSDSSLDLVFDAGTAYVNGYRVENESPPRLTIPKPRSTETVSSQSVPFQYGNYVIATDATGLPDLDFAQVEVKNAINGGGTTIATARVRAIEEDGAVYKVYLFDVQGTDNMRFAKSLLESNGNYINLSPLVDANGAPAVKLFDVTNNDLLFRWPRPRPAQFSSANITTQRHFSATATSNTATISGLSATENFIDPALWVVTDTTGTVIPGNITITGSGATSQASIPGLADGAVEIYAYVSKSLNSNDVAQKTLTEVTVTDTITTGSTGIRYIDLTYHDIYEIVEVKRVDAAGEDISSMFYLDNGQRDNYYDIGKLILKEDYSDPGSVYVKLKYFARSSPGSFYAFNSYGIQYKNIPNYTLKNGTTIPLREYIDFRPDKLANGTFSNVMELPRNGANMISTIQYYLPRADKVIVTTDGVFSVLLGEQEANPKFKPTPDNALELYQIILNGNTLGPEDVQVRPTASKRYTMTEIGNIERKLNELEQFTRLSLIELENKLDLVLDSDGVERIVAGMIGDDFSNQTTSGTNSTEYRASIDPESRTLRPLFDADNIRLVNNTSVSSNVVVRGDNAYLRYDSATWLEQDLCSTYQAVNPFGLVDNVGVLTLSPASDEWKGTSQPGTAAIPGSSAIGTNEAQLWNSWQWNWQGKNLEDYFIEPEQQIYQVGSGIASATVRTSLTAGDKYYTDQTTISNPLNVVNVSDAVRRQIDGRNVTVAVVPWIRSRKIYFKAQGLKPNTEFKAFFDGVSVDDWVREEPFVRYSGDDTSSGTENDHPGVTQHPEIPSSLVSNDNGEIEGSFFIPNITPTYGVPVGGNQAQIISEGLRFRAGVKEFKLLDITVNDYNLAGSKAVAYYTAAGALNTSSATTTTRANNQLSPNVNLDYLNIFANFTPKELANYLNQVTAGNVNLISPTVPGQGNTVVDPSLYLGNMSTILNDYVNVDNNNNAGTGVQPLKTVLSPLSQSFTVDNQFGITLTDVTVYFRTRDNELPIQLQIRPMKNGSPSKTEMVPGSSVFLNPSDATIPVVSNPETATLAQIKAKPTKFTFEEPIYLSPYKQYAIVLLSGSVEYTLWIAKAGDFVKGSTSKQVTTQSAGGALFLPQSSTSWTASKNLDMMYKVSRAVFDTNGTLMLRNADVPGKLLDPNPIRTTNASSDIYIQHKCHGMDVGETVIISGLTVGQSYGGILGENINGSRTITSADINGYVVAAGSAANANSTVGGSAVIASRNIQYSVMNPAIDTVIPAYTSIGVSGKLVTGKSISGSETPYIKDATFKKLTPKVNHTYTTPRRIANVTNQNASIAADGNGQKYSADIKIDMKSSNNYVSPIVDLQRCSMILVQYCIDDPQTVGQVNQIAETAPQGGTTGSKYVTQPITLTQDATGLQIKYDANIPPGSEVDTYYRTALEGQNIQEIAWVPAEVRFPIYKTSDASNFTEAEFLPGGTQGNLDAFNQAQVKLVFRSNNIASVPTIQNLRIKSLGL